MSDNLIKQNDLDDELLKNPGDSRTEFHPGSIKLSNGDIIPTNVEAIRKRNEHGGVDCTIKIHKL